MNSHPQCVKDEDGCGYPEWLSTSPRDQFLVHRLSRCYPLLIHGLSTILWIKGVLGGHTRDETASDILRT